jgi:hypothetical protein
MAILRVGDGTDGDITLDTGTGSKNINSDVIDGSRTYADGVFYRVTAISSNYVDTSGGVNGIVAGDEVILINTGGEPGNYDNAGNYEIFTVDYIDGTEIHFTQPINKNYGDDGGNSNLGNHPVMVQRVPNYNNMTIDDGVTLTCDDIDAYNHKDTGGLMIFKVKETLNIINGYVSANYKGFRGHVAVVANNTGYGEGYGRGFIFNDAGGAGHVTDGGNGSSGGKGYAYVGATSDLTKIRHGSGGGAGGITAGGPRGGDGGGTIFVTANTITISTGGFICKGQTGVAQGAGPDGGAGSGGSILVHAGSVTIPNNTINAEGASGVGTGGYGSDGIIAIHYQSGSVGTTAPTAYTETISSPYKIGGTVSVKNIAYLRIHNNITGELLSTYSGIGIGSYEVDAPGDGSYDIIAKATDGQIMGYGNVTAYEI